MAIDCSCRKISGTKLNNGLEQAARPVCAREGIEMAGGNLKGKICTHFYECTAIVNRKLNDHNRQFPHSTIPIYPVEFDRSLLPVSP